MTPLPLQEEESLCEINVTPFVDVLLVLLVIFMITAPIIHHTLKIDLPEDSQSDGPRLDKSLRVVVDRKGMIYVNNDKIGVNLTGKNQEKFQKRIQEWFGSKKSDKFVDLEADENVKYGAIVPIIARLKEMGVGLNLIIDPQ